MKTGIGGRVGTVVMPFLLSAAIIVATTASADAVGINTNVLADYNAFAVGATVQTFEGIVGITPLGLTSYANALNSSTVVPAGAQLSLDISGLLFHSGGGSFNNPVGNPGTPTAVLQLGGAIAGNAHSATNVVGSANILTDPADPVLLDLDQFIEIVFINSLQSRVGVWLNPALGNVTLQAFDSTGTSLESVVGTAGNFVGIQRAAADIKFVSIVGGVAGFTVDDLTFAGAAPTASVPEPGMFALLGLGSLALLRIRRNG